MNCCTLTGREVVGFRLWYKPQLIIIGMYIQTDQKMQRFFIQTAHTRKDYTSVTVLPQNNVFGMDIITTERVIISEFLTKASLNLASETDTLSEFAGIRNVLAKISSSFNTFDTGDGIPLVSILIKWQQ